MNGSKRGDSARTTTCTSCTTRRQLQSFTSCATPREPSIRRSGWKSLGTSLRPKRFEKKVSKLKDRRLIEENFPVKEVSAESSKEKSIRHGHISTLHIWWARRPLASSRATNYAALVPAPRDAEEWNRKRDFIISLCKWENSLDQTILEKAR